ncbi:MAG TPA: AAA family ATPase [Sedimentisphaerales bacterium]|nr:AAA family ATPase [Sedimentisphaerales bacterium]
MERLCETVSEVFETASDAAGCLERRHGKPAWNWVYYDAHGDPAGLILRWDGPEGKQIRPVSRRLEGGWVIGGMPEPRPLYELPTLLARTDETVYVTEGEKAADAGSWMGLLATTSPHGAASAGKTDWRPLAGRDVVILPDNDEPGRRYAQAVVSILQRLSPPPRVRIVELPGLPPKGDLFDWVDACPAEGFAARGRELEALVRTAKVLPSAGAGAAGTSIVPVLQCFADVVPSSIRWLWPGRMPLGRITLLVGRPGEGKSFLTTDLAARISRGRPWPDGVEGVEGSVIFICAEDDPSDTLRPRLEAHGADLSKVHLLQGVRRTGADGRCFEAPFTLADTRTLESCLQSHPDCRLIVVDPIGSYLGSGTDSYRDSEVRAVLDPVTRLSDLYGPAVLVVAHRRKDAGTTHADDLALGSRAFTGVARSVWHLTRDRQNKKRRLLLPGKNNLAEEGQGLAFTIEGTPAAIRWESEPVDLSANEALAAEGVAERSESDSPVRRSTREWLRELLLAGPVSVPDVRREAQQAGFCWRTVQRVKSEMAVRSIRTCQVGPWLWKLADN